MELILIACSKTKIAGGEAVFRESELEKRIPSHTFRRLSGARYELARLLGLPAGPDLGTCQQDSSLAFLPAYRRYDGIVYRRGRLWTLIPQAQGMRVLIVSALYGVLDAEDPIRLYEAHMASKLPDGSSIARFWKHQRLGELLDECIAALGLRHVHDLLSKSYRSALGPWPPRSITEGNISHQEYQYPGQGSGASYSRGDDLRRLLSRGSTSHPVPPMQPEVLDHPNRSIARIGHSRPVSDPRPPSQRELIRRTVFERVIKTARSQGRRTVTIRASEVARLMNLSNRYPNICGALDSQQFQRLAGGRLLQRTGPAQSSSVTWTYEL